MTKPDDKPVVEENRFFDRCVELVERPVWLDALTEAVPSLQKESGEIVILVTDPNGDLKLCGFLIASGGQIVYEFQSDVAIQDEKPFWGFASTNYIWLTPTIKLRKTVAAEVGGKADGQSFKLASDEMTVESFIEAVVAPAAPKEKARPAKKAAPAESAIEPIAEAAAPEEQASATVILEMIPESGGESVVEVVQAKEPQKLVCDLAVGQSMSMF